ncbi:MAG TPA: aminodeoxychorismate synthase component I [Micromonosporaceae bacterium]|nr:aminodeoxychorismate synthase component I [Micromonosporaceae bacterium]
MLIDNYDSYTYNLFQLLTRTCQAELVVMANDDERLRRLDPERFDAVVISPGPGRPQHHSDLGWCRNLLDEQRGLPVLGVCLGHQALAYQAGARVVEGVPRHGHLTRLRHDGAELFAGLPQGLVVTRYHSLHVAEPLPSSLVATAWAEDDTVMAVRHTDLPRWGVQFHPESVATEHGDAIVANFARLITRRVAPTVARHGPPRITVATRPSPAPDVPAGALTLSVSVIDRAVDPASVFQELYASSRFAFWLDSSLAEPGRARFSFLGDASGPLAEVLTYQVGEGTVSVCRGDTVVRESGSIFDVLERRLADRTLAGSWSLSAAGETRTARDLLVELPFDLTGGYVGYFGYEMKADCGGSAVHLADTPDAVWMFADRLITVDHHTGTTYLVAVHSPDAAAASAAGVWLKATAVHLEQTPPASPAVVARVPAGRVLSVDSLAAEVELERDRDRYLADIKECGEELRRGESYEICLTNRIHLPPLPDPLRYYRALRKLNPVPYAAYLRLGGVTVMSSSPERFLRIGRDGTAESRPIKGTVPRHEDPGTDEELRASLVSSGKTRAENLMIVDLQRNDLGRVCEVGSVEVPDYLVTESYATVHQLVSTVRGRLLPTVSPVECARACFPAGSMTGAPKIRTMGIIDRLEGSARGVYSGALGYFGLSGGADLSVVIRTAVATEDGVRVGTGGAIVIDSDPEAEFAETIHKVRPLLSAYRSTEGDGGAAERPRSLGGDRSKEAVREFEGAQSR